MAPPSEGDDSKTDGPDYGNAIQQDTFEQILEMDDDGSREFSREIVFGFFDQSRQTLENMKNALKKRKLKELSDLGHYLKGSSATLGLTRVRDACEKIQHYGALKNDAGDDTTWDDDVALKKIAEILPFLQEYCTDAEGRLRAFYANIGS